MIAPLHPLHIFVSHGDYYFADRDTRISTVVGKSVAMTFWHPELLIGGRCHDVREAAALLLEEMGFVGACHQEYHVKLFGSAPGIGTQSSIHGIQAARRLVAQYGFTRVTEHWGEVGHYTVVFDVWSGDVQVNPCNLLPIAEPQLIKRSLG